MPTFSVMFGVILTAIGVVAYLAPESLGVGKDGQPPKAGQMSSLSPAFVGGVLLLAGLVSLAAEGARKHAMHLAAMAGLLGTIGGFVPVILRGGNFAEVAVKVGLSMAVFSAIFTALCVNSFIQARKARQATAQPVA